MSNDTPSHPDNAVAATNELARVARVLKTLCNGNRMVLRAGAEDDLFTDMCKVIVESGYRCAGVVLAQFDERKSLRWAAMAGELMGGHSLAQYTWADDESGGGAAGTAIRTAQIVVRRDLLTDPMYDDPILHQLLEEAAEVGFSAVAAFPMRHEGAVFGAMIIGASDGSAFDQDELALLDELAQTLAFGVVSLRTQAQRKQAEAMIARLAYFDQLTGLPNRTSLLSTLQQHIAACSARGAPLALLHLEVSRYRGFNKILGYQAADALIIEVCRRLAVSPHDGALLARVGEAEFAVVLAVGDVRAAMRVADALLQSMRAPVDVRGMLLNARLCIGVALFPDHGEGASELMSRANAALQQVSPLTGGCAIYHGGREEESRRRLAMLGDLYRALGRNELSLLFQPKVQIQNRRVCGAEALVRWRHPAYESISTQELIAAVEEAGMIGQLTEWVMAAAFLQSGAWHEAGIEQTIAINLSAHDLYDENLVERTRDLLGTYRVAPEWIEFELTESALMADPAAARQTLVKLRGLKVPLHIDDYGTGYSSLSYLQQFPVDCIKIDRSLVAPLADSPSSAAIVASTIALGHRLGLKVIAEGVEDRRVWARLAKLGCDFAQGYFISKPMSAGSYVPWLRDWAMANPDLA